MYLKQIISAILLLNILFFACKEEPNNPVEPLDPPLPSCEGAMFGQPVEATNLDSSICNPSCECLNFTSENFTPAQLENLQTWKLSTSFSALLSDPYEKEAEEKSEAPIGCCGCILELAAGARVCWWGWWEHPP